MFLRKIETIFYVHIMRIIISFPEKENNISSIPEIIKFSGK